MQFETPDTNTPAIDTDGCLNYTLAKLSARYNLPVPGVSLLSDSYDYYTAFSEKVLSGGATKMDSLANSTRRISPGRNPSGFPAIWKSASHRHMRSALKRGQNAHRATSCK